jgi:ribonuclease E
VLVQISRLGFEGKGVKLTGRIALEGSGMILRPGGKAIELPRKLKDTNRRAELASHLKSVQADDDGITLRSAALDWDAAAISGEYKLLKAQWLKAVAALTSPAKPTLIAKAQSDVDQIIERHLMAGRDCVVDGTDEFVRLRGMLKARGMAEGHLTRHGGARLLFGDQGIDADISDALATRVDLPGGGWIAIDQATALTAIDLNAGGAEAGVCRDSDARAAALNLRAAAEIVHQIKLRNIGGLIVVDPLRMKNRVDRDKFDGAIKDAFGAELDGALQIGGFTRLGLYEFSRQRSGESLAAQILGKPDASPLNRESALNHVVRGLVAEARNGMAGSVRVSVAPSLVDGLAQSDELRQILIKEFGAMPEITGDPVLEQDAFRLEKK